MLADELDGLRLGLGKHASYKGKIRLPDKIKLDLPTLVLLPDFEQAFFVRAVDATTPKPSLSEAQILTWINEHKTRTGDWPTRDSGPIADVYDENWGAIDLRLKRGGRGLPGKASLAKLLFKYHGIRNKKDLPKLTIAQVLDWTDKYHARTGKWPKRDSGKIHESRGETWLGIDAALIHGLRGLDRGPSLAQLLEQHREVRTLALHLL
jgi:hypothetical protein